ncbi:MULTISPECIES: hypothetical protein [Actinosynnema]|uniref:effector-associated constant component EACC1 n=1 Tax=Actinosynnema TaxID=40566 RepID=UPI0020A291F2|nr:hypothetical protein [Actinosynnema pretiosum]MCP2096266.1 hypothetical protein [Actinosynnema pretiosum]
MDYEGRLELRISDNAELLSLQRLLSLAQNTYVERVPGAPVPGLLGAADYLTVVGSGAGLIALIKMLPNFLRARRSDLRIEITDKDEAGKDRTTAITAKNVKDVMPIVVDLSNKLRNE